MDFCVPALRVTVSRLFDDWGFVLGTPCVDRPYSRDSDEVWSDHQELVLRRPRSPKDGDYLLQFSSKFAVAIFCDQKQIVEHILDRDLSESAREHYLVDQVLPRILDHQGDLVIHAGASRVDGRAIVLLGKSGRGKSTLAASFDSAGYDLIGDDALVISSFDLQPRVETVYPSLRLFPDSVAAVLNGSPAMSEVTPHSSKQRITIPSHSEIAGSAFPIDAMFVLAPAASTDLEVRKMRTAELCMAMVENSFSLDPTDLRRAQARLANCSSVAREVPGYMISYPRDYALLPRVRDKILAQLT